MPLLWMWLSVGLVGMAFLGAVVSLLLAHYTEPGVMKVEPNSQETSYHIIHDGRNCELQQFRAKFCRTTNNCIARFDHYCPWISNAVGARNYKHFYCFILLVSLLDLFEAASSLLLILYKCDSHHITLRSFIESAEKQPCASVIILYSFLVSLLICPLFVYHSWLLSRNITTNEHIKDVYNQRNPNPYDRGCVRNCFGILCIPTPQSDVLEFVEV